MTGLRWVFVVTGLLTLAGGSAWGQTPRRGIDEMRSRGTGSNSSPAASRHHTPDNRGFVVEAFTPQGPIDQGDVILVTFSRDLPKNLSPEILAAAISTNPPLEFDASQETPRVLRFSTRRSFRGATNFKVSVNPALVDSTGKALEGQKTFEFQTPALAISNVNTAELRGNKAVFSLSFNYRVQPHVLQDHLQVFAGNTVLPITVRVPFVGADSLLVEATGVPQGADKLRVRFRRGLRAAVGPLGFVTDHERLIPLRGGMELERVSSDWEGGKPIIRIQFSAELGSDFERHIQVTPKVPFRIRAMYSTLVLEGDFQPNTRYQITVNGKLASSSGNSLGQTEQQDVFITDEPPFLSLNQTGGYLSPQGRMKLQVSSKGFPALQVRGWRIYDTNLPKYGMEDEGEWRFKSYAQRVISQRVTIENFDRRSITELDLKDLLGPHGPGVYRFEVTALETRGTDETDSNESGYSGYNESAILNISDLAVVAKTGRNDLAVWVAQLSSAQPLADADVEIYSQQYQPLGRGRTDSLGFVSIHNPAFSQELPPRLVVVSKGQDRTFLSLDNSQIETPDSPLTEGRRFLGGGFEAFTTTERGAYRPGEIIRLFGFVRNRQGLGPDRNLPLQLILTAADGRRLPPRLITVQNTTGWFETTATIGRESPTGLWRASLRMPFNADEVWLRTPESDGYGEEENFEDSLPPVPGGLDQEVTLAPGEVGAADFFVEEFLPNRLQVKATAPEGRHSLNRPLVVRVTAEEMFGAPAPDRPFEGRVILTAEPFTPTGFPEFQFGDSERNFTRETKLLEERNLDSNGRGEVEIELPAVTAPASLKATVLLTVKDQGGRGVTTRLQRFVDPVPAYLGIGTPDRSILRLNEPHHFPLISVSPDGKLASLDSQTSVTIFQVRWNSILERQDGRLTYQVTRELTPIMTHRVDLRGGRGELVFEPTQAGAYLIRGEIQSASGSPGPTASTSLSVFASSGQWADQAWSLEKPERITLQLDRSSYTPGDEAKVLVQAPFPGTLLLTVEQDKVLRQEVHRMETNTIELPLKVDESLLPHGIVTATVIRAVRPAGRWMPHRALGATRLHVDSSPRRLALEWQTPTEVRPDSTAEVALRIMDPATSRPVSGAVAAVWAVDEGILSLTDFATPNPLGFFYGLRAHGVRHSDLFSALMPDLLPASATAAPGGGEAGRRNFASPVTADRVKPVALWLGFHKTGDNGQIPLSVTIPNYIGRLRFMAVAAEGPRFGQTEAGIPVKNPIMIREAFPRFASPGDQLFIPLTLFNSADSESTMTVRVEATPPLTPIAAARWRESTPGTIELETTVALGSSSTRIAEIQVQRETGVAQIKVSVTMGEHRHEESLELPVRPAFPSIRQSRILEIAAGKSQEIPPPPVFLPGTDQSRGSVGGIPLLQYGPALLELLRFPHGCSEQIAAAAFPLLVLPDLAERIEPQRLHLAGRTRAIQQSVDRLLAMQNRNGSFPDWPESSYAHPYHSVFITHFLMEAENAGFQVPPTAKEAALRYLISLTSEEDQSPNGVLLQAYGHYVLSLAGVPRRANMESLANSLSSDANEARALLAAAFVSLGRSNRAEKLLETQGEFRSVRDSEGTYASPVRETALLLLANLKAASNQRQIAALANRLRTLQRPDGHFGSTQDNAFALLAFGRLFQANSSRSPMSGTVTFADGSEKPFSDSAPLSWDQTNPAKSIQSSSGQAFAFITNEGVPLQLGPTETTVTRGLTVTRRFFDRAGNSIIPRRLPQGQLLQVEVTLEGPDDLGNVVVEDLIPAGLEVENPLLVSEAQGAGDPRQEGQMSGLTVLRTEVRDDRYVAFVRLNKSQQQRTFRYMVRAITAGTFQMGPVQAEALYDPAFLARSGQGLVSIEPRRAAPPPGNR
jgi:uncharacterized protein YfaS (alpha-2-macroglobulin family)